jgi:arginine/lysine/ornithine decarboxylase
LKDGPDLVAANFVIPYPPGFPIMVPGQVITRGCDAAEGLKLVRADALVKHTDSVAKRAA